MATAAMVVVATPVSAASIHRLSIPGYQAIEIKDEIVAGDFNNFTRVVKTMNVGMVRIYLDSRGGLLTEGFKIGFMIHELGYATVAHNTCASSCANIWLAGAQRWVIPGARIGFHRSSVQGTPRKTDSHADELQRDYYTRVGYTNQAGIDWMLSAEPWDMNWLGDDNGRKYNIAFSIMTAQVPPIAPVARNSSITEEQKLLADPKWLGKHASPTFQRLWRQALDRDKLHWPEQY
jgi:hypothetical protein